MTVENHPKYKIVINTEGSKDTRITPKYWVVVGKDKLEAHIFYTDLAIVGKFWSQMVETHIYNLRYYQRRTGELI